MIQARKDGNITKEQKPEDQVTSSPTQRTAPTIRTVHSLDQRRATFVTNTVGGPTAVILSEGSTIPEGSTLQYRRVSIGPQLQHVVTPVQVQGTSSASVSESGNPRCTVTSTQDLAHILVAATSNSPLHTVELQNSIVNVSASMPQQFQTLGNITNAVTSAQRTANAAVIAQTGAQTPRIVLNSGGISDVYALRITPTTLGSGGSSQQIMVLDSSASLTPSSDVTKVHSYSLASAAVSSLAPTSAMQKIVISASGQPLQVTSMPHKSPITHNQLRTGVKRQLLATSPVRTNVLTVNNTELLAHMSSVNKLLCGLVPCEGKISSIPNSPKVKRMKLDKSAVVGRDLAKRKKVAEHLERKFQLLKTKYYQQQTEYYFLKHGGNLVDFIGWRKKMKPVLLEYLKTNRFDSQDDVKAISDVLSQSTLQTIGNPTLFSQGSPADSSSPKSSSSSSHTQAFRTASVSSSSPRLVNTSSSVQTAAAIKNVKQPVVSHKHSSKNNSISSVYDSQIGSQEEIVERAKQEAYVMQRVGDLRKEGLWSLKKLPKVAEGPRIKAHWDYLLEEMAWLATDFAQERKWKKANAKKCARMITKYFQEKEIKAEKAEKEEQMKLRKIASTIAREIKQFWSNIEKLAEYKQQTWLEEKRKKVLDTHLNFIVDQTEKYSSWLTQGMNRSIKDSPESSRASTPIPGSTPQSPKKRLDYDSDDFEPSGSDIDDEATIQKEEEDINEAEQNEEIKLLQQESEMPFEDFLESLPPEILSSHTSLNDSKLSGDLEASCSSTTKESNEDKTKVLPTSDDDDFQASDEEEDDEQTLLEQESEEKDVDHDQEMRDLEAENELSIEELRAKYSAAYASDFEVETSEHLSGTNDSESSDEYSEDESKDDDNESSLKELTSQDQNESDNPSKEISDIAAAAESFQPKGNTLSTTQVCTKIPFLLKHNLREYQHIGLDWLNAMYEKKLNGILADEMGLGKTIQTISMLAHLACEKGVWGPHLIVVPTSVMLNWEMEFKKWCPAFKILTYYGTPKERKQKRVGWTKFNAFHVCITSYKLVVQDHQSFRRKKWKYLILDEAQHIKNFKSQRWQMLLNFQSSHRLLLTGTPLQNNLMELWSLMHFLMPNVFQSHREFKEWFVNPVTGMIEGNHEYNESLIKRLHKVLRPFLLRRLKCEVEKQLPKKYEHVVVCRLSNRQRYLYDDFMSQTKTKETLATGNFMSVINILMQLRKVCNHPNMFEERPTVSPFLMEGISYRTASLVYGALDYDPFKHINLSSLNLLLADLELSLTAFAAHRVKKFQVPPKLIVEIDNLPEPPPPCPQVKMKVNFCNSQVSNSSAPAATTARTAAAAALRLPANTPNRLNTPPTAQPQRYMVIPGQQVARAATPVTSASGQTTTGQTEQYTLQLVQPGAVVTSTPKVGNPSATPPFLTNITRPQTNSTSVTTLNNQNVHSRPFARVASFNGHSPATPSVDSSVTQNHVQSTKSPVVHSLTKSTPKSDAILNVSNAKKNSAFYLESLAQAREQQRKECLRTLAKINNRRCGACPIYGRDLVEAVTIIHSLKHPDTGSPWQGKGYVNCLNAIPAKDNPSLYWDHTETLSNIIKTPEDRVAELTDIINRFVFVIPAVTSPPVQLHVSHPAPWKLNEENMNVEKLNNYLAPACAFLHPIVSNMKTQFPELRLIQYDCGKLQRLAHLLWELKKDHHRVLIFTQMTRMLDILEQFLNYHGHTYLRLDGNTKVEQRQALMERFNADKRIFCFILSTRSGGVGVNLTGADTVIFYDSDWNPTMDAQAQDRCHRIGQTRDVHIYRLISERTIEENILKKANQKRILGDVAIEGGNFTTAFFKKNSIHELFGIETVIHEEEKKIEEIPSEKACEEGEKFSQKELEQALGMAEEESDLQAAQTASAEAVAELAEFDESIPLDNDSRDNEEKSAAEEELDKLMYQLSPVERYALKFLESFQESVSLEQLKLAEEEIEAQKKDWELGHLKALKEEEERRSRQLRDEDSPLFCSREAANQIWAPPTPPTNENDIYIDYSVTFWYESSLMHEARLPPVFIKKEAKRLKIDPVVSAVATTRKQKVRKDDMVNIPRSLFDRPSAAILKMRREVKLQKVKGLMVGTSSLPKPSIASFPGLKQPPLAVVNKPTVDPHQDKPDWLVQEDWAILQVVQELQGIPLSLTVLMPAQTPNWDMASEAVYAVSRNYRSPKVCRNRYENVIVPREEGKILYDTNPKKQKKTKGIYKTKNNRPMKTSQLFVQDNNSAFTKIINDRYKWILEAAARRKANEKQTVLQQSKNVKIASILAENGINYDAPLAPTQIAANRAERIAREKQKTQTGTGTVVLTPAVLQPSAQTTTQVSEQPIPAQRQVTQQATVAVSGTTNLNAQQAQAVIASLQQAQQLQVQLSKANLQSGTVASVSLAKSLTSGIMVNASSAGTLANLTKALGQVTSITTQDTAQNAAIAAALNNAGIRNQRATVTAVGTTTTMTVQEMVVAAATAGQVRAVTTVTGGISTAPAVVSVSNLTAVQLAASQRLAGTTLSPATTVASAAVNQLNAQTVTPQRLSQIQALRQNAILRQRSEQAAKQQHQLKRLQTVQQQASQPSAKVAIGTAGTLTVAAQQRVAQQVTMKQSRPITEAEMTQLMKRQQLQKQAAAQVNLTTAQILAQAQLQVQPQQVSITGGTATLVKTVSAPGTSSLAIPVSAVTVGGVNINVSVPQGKVGTVPAKASITNQQIRQFQLQQQLLSQARKNKAQSNLTQLAKVQGKGASIAATSLTGSMNAVQIVQHNPQVGSTQQVKGLPTAMTVQQIQQAMKQAIPQNLPVVVTATPSLPSVPQQQQSVTLRGEPGVASSVKAQTTTLPSTTLTTSGVLKGTPAVVVGQQQTAAILQQVAASQSGLTPQAVTLAVRATQGQQQQVQIQVQPQSVSAALQNTQNRIQQQNAAQVSSILSPTATIVQQVASDSSVPSSTHVVMHTVATCSSTSALTLTTSQSNAQVVQAAMQVARQQQQQAAAAAAAAQQQKASPYTMRLRNPPK
ncbi:unnamed protein product [Larinioides sclopetarius]|uniref:Helicase domino n=1 Tax=Larinioides sclopetarius TaxID=280406 RepID=A0AAV2B4D6_9ARAC